MNAGDLVEFKCIGAGKTDDPPYSQDGEWRTGLVVSLYPPHGRASLYPMAHIFYRGVIFKALAENCQPAVSCKKQIL